MRNFPGCKFVLVFAAAFFVPLLSTSQNAPSGNTEVQQHIQHVTSGLIGQIVIKGDEHATHTLADRMKELNVPGVSIAVLHNGKIEWARGLPCLSLWIPAFELA